MADGGGFEGSKDRDANPFESNTIFLTTRALFLFFAYEQTTAKEKLDAFSQAVIDVTPEQLSQECGVDYGPTLQLLSQLRTYTSILLDSANRSINLMSCRNIVPLYTETIYKGTCSQSIKGATWIFSSFFVIAFFGMVMIMFRAAYYPVYLYDYGDDKSLGNTSSEDNRQEDGLSEVDEGEEILWEEDDDEEEGEGDLEGISLDDSGSQDEEE
jgi:hypothetical protein